MIVNSEHFVCIIRPGVRCAYSHTGYRHKSLSSYSHLNFFLYLFKLNRTKRLRTDIHIHIQKKRVSTIKSQSASCFYCLIRLLAFLYAHLKPLWLLNAERLFSFSSSFSSSSYFSLFFAHIFNCLFWFLCMPSQNRFHSFSLFYSIPFILSFFFNSCPSLTLCLVFHTPFSTSLLLSSLQFSVSTFDNFDARNSVVVAVG